MKTAISLLLGLSGVLPAAPEADRTAWQWQAPFAVGPAGMVRLELPPPVLDVSRSDLGDVRVLSPSGVETPYLIEQPVQCAGTVRDGEGFKVALSGSSTVMEAGTGTTIGIEAVVLVSPAREFLKSVTIEGRQGGGEWQTLAAHEVIFRQTGGAERLTVPIPAGAWDRLRCTVNDERAHPVPFAGMRLLAVGVKPASVDLPVALGTREELAGESRVTLDLGACNLNVAEIHLEIPDAVFSRMCGLAVATSTADGGAHLDVMARGTIYRVLGEHGGATESLVLPLQRRVAARYLVATFRNGDSPPLTITGAKVRCYPTVLALHAAPAGEWRLLTGNHGVKVPVYDLEPLRATLATTGGRHLVPGPLTAKTDYQRPPALPGVEPEGAAINLADWTRRRAVNVARSGVVRIELDALALAGCQSDLGDLRLIQNGRQIPYLIKPGTVTREMTPGLAALPPDPQRPTVARWEVTLPVANVPAVDLTALSSALMFSRRFEALITRKDELGNAWTDTAGTAEWRKSGGGATPLALSLGGQRMPRTFLLQTNHGDNPPIPVEDVKVRFSAPSIAAKLTDSAPLFLYYGNAKATLPKYDLQLVRNALLAADQQPANLGGEELLRPEAREKQGVDAGSPWMWLALGGVVIVLLAVVAKLLPRPAES